MKEFTRLPTQYEIDQEQARQSNKYRNLSYLSLAISIVVISLNMFIKGVF